MNEDRIQGKWKQLTGTIGSTAKDAATGHDGHCRSRPLVAQAQRRRVPLSGQSLVRLLSSALVDGGKP